MGTPVRPDLVPFGRFLAERREASGLTRKELAQEIDSDPSTVIYWEQGRNEPTDERLVQVARALSVPVADVARLVPKYRDVLDGATVGTRMQRARWAISLTPEELAARLGLTPYTLRQWEHDHSLIPTARIADLEGILGPLDVPAREPTAPRAGVLKWMGKKPAALLSLIPTSATYVEPYGGSASVLLARPAAAGMEVYNDLHGDLTNLFRALQDEERSHKLHHRLSLTLYSRAEYQRAMRVLARSKSPDDRAWAFFVLINQSFNGVEKHTESNWASPSRTHLSTWWGRVAWVGSWHERLAGVIIENLDALAVIRRYDSPSTTFYLDPPFVRSTRNNKGKLYRREMTNEHHESLVERILGVRGAVVLAGYPSPLYEPLEAAGWERHDLVNRNRAESVWRNQRALEMAA